MNTKPTAAFFKRKLTKNKKLAILILKEIKDREHIRN
jgi:hypothetical protein